MPRKNRELIRFFEIFSSACGILADEGGQFAMNNPYQHSVIDYYVSRLRRMRRERKELLSSLSSLDDALAYQKRMRGAVAAAFAPFREYPCHGAGDKPFGKGFRLSDLRRAGAEYQRRDSHRQRNRQVISAPSGRILTLFQKFVLF